MNTSPDTIRQAPPPEYTVSGGYRPGAAGSSPEGLSSLPAVAGSILLFGLVDILGDEIAVMN